MLFLKLLLSGILIGSAMIIPGVSGCAIAVIIGVYDKAVESFNKLFKDFKNNFLYLFFIGIGVLLGCFLFGKILVFLYTNYNYETKFSFIGIILGGIFYLFKNVKEKNEKVNYNAIIITFVFSLLIFIVSKNVLNINIGSNLTTLNMFICGFVYSFGKVIPGISGAFLLIILGTYKYLLNIIANPLSIKLNDLKNIIPFLMGLILGIIILIKVISKLLNNKFSFIYSIIIGFVLSSIITLIPIVSSFLQFLIGILFLVLFFIISFKFFN